MVHTFTIINSLTQVGTFNCQDLVFSSSTTSINKESSVAVLLSGRPLHYLNDDNHRETLHDCLDVVFSVTCSESMPVESIQIF